ncbi:MAG: hypothetical protein J6P45_01315 [Lachnospiraceae bacterium]|nr:hypothetical protein [Lachnospiraceae bacterium]
MEKYIENLIKGSFEYESDKLEVSEKKIEADTAPGEDCDGSFILSSRTKKSVSLSVLVSDLRIRISVKKYEGDISEGLKVLYSISSKGLDSGYIFKGEIYIISDIGEVKIPVVMEVKRQYLNSSAGLIKNLFHFTNLARSDFDEAVNIFYRPEFSGLFYNTERTHLLKYRGFVNGERSGENVEEFLISVNKKTPVVYSFSEENISLLDVTDDEKGSFEIRKSGWGYTHFELETDSEFIELEKTGFNDYDFVTSSITVGYRIKADRLHDGINYGLIMLHSLHSDISLPVFINNGIVKKSERDRDLRFKKLLYELTECYIQFRIKDITANAWINRTREIVDRMLHLDKDSPVVRLYQVNSLLISKRDREAGILLNKIEQEFDIKSFSPELKGYYIYLKAMGLEGEELEEAVRTVWELYEAQGKSGKLLWILLYLDETIKISPLREKELLLKQFERGCDSPLLLIEAYKLFSKEPDELNRLDTVELKVLYFAVKRGLFNKALCDRISLLSSRSRGYNELLMKVLGAYYEEFNDDECLSAICSYLIRNEITQKRFGRYFKAAVERELKITNLYEYFLYTLPENTVSLLPKSVLIYFSLENDLPAFLTAYVFANMIVHEAETSILLEESRTRMAEFALEQLSQGRVDENLAVIYDYLGYFKGSEFGVMSNRALMDNALTDIAFIRLIKCTDKRVHYVIIVESRLRDEKKYVLKNGAAYVKICTAEYEVFFETETGERFCRSNEGYDEIPLVHTPTVVRQVDSLAINDLSLTMYMCERGRSGSLVDGSNVVFVRRAYESADVTALYKEEIRMELLRYYFDSEMNEDLDSFISAMDFEQLRMDERSELLRYMVMRDMAKEAYGLIMRYGVSGTDARMMVRLLSQLLPESANEPYEWLISMCWYVFSEGKYNDLVLAYLINHYDGTTRNLRRIWNAGNDFELEVRSIEEKILLQMLKTGSYIGEKDEIFFDYLKRGAVSGIALAYLSSSAYGYFVKERVTDDRIFAELADNFEDGTPLNDVCMLSLIKYYSDKHRDERIRDITGECIRKCLEKNIMFSFFNEYTSDVNELKLYADLSFVEYRTNPKNRVVLHYILNDASDGKVSYIKEEMSNVYGGIFCKKFVLFQGERLQYYITEESEGSENLTVSGVVEKDIELKGTESTRYDMLNELILCESLEDYNSMMSVCREYLKKKSVAEAILGGLKSV